MTIPTRPVIPGFHPDPSVCRVGDAYYLASSSFEYAPGVPIHRSTDLCTWEHVGNALDRPTQLSVTGALPSGGIFAPTLRHHDSRFWLITTNMTDPRGQLLVTAEDPAGPWSDPVFFADAPGIDPDLSWDADGTCRLTWSGFADGRPLGIVQAVVDPATGAVLSEPRPLRQGTGGKFPEGPHVYRVGDSWYQLIAEGGTERGHAVTIARGPAPSGPWEPSPHNPLLTARGTDSPVQNAGHADLVQRPDGGWRLTATGAGEQPAFAGRRQAHLYARARAALGAGNGEGGLELRVDPRHALRAEVADGRVRAGRMVGLVCTRGSLDVRSFTYTGADDPASVAGRP